MIADEIKSRKPGPPDCAPSEMQGSASTPPTGGGSLFAGVHQGSSSTTSTTTASSTTAGEGQEIDLTGLASKGNDYCDKVRLKNLTYFRQSTFFRMLNRRVIELCVFFFFSKIKGFLRNTKISEDKYPMISIVNVKFLSQVSRCRGKKNSPKISFHLTPSIDPHRVRKMLFAIFILKVQFEDIGLFRSICISMYFSQFFISHTMILESTFWFQIWVVYSFSLQSQFRLGMKNQKKCNPKQF